MELATGRVIIELAPAFAPEHVGNIRTLAREHFWDGTSIYRSQDNFVVQLGDPDGDEPAKAKSLGSAKKHLPAEFHRDAKGLMSTRSRTPTAGRLVGFVDGFHVGRDPKAGNAWLAHCYGTVGAGRNNADDSSVGAELYVVIGQSPRQLDDNITVVGQACFAGNGVAEHDPPGSCRPRVSTRTPPSEHPSGRSGWPAKCRKRSARHCRCGGTDTKAFREAMKRRGAIASMRFYKRPAGHIDLCNVSGDSANATKPLTALP